MKEHDVVLQSLHRNSGALEFANESYTDLLSDSQTKKSKPYIIYTKYIDKEVSYTDTELGSESEIQLKTK